MAKINEHRSLSFDDVLLVPSFSEVHPQEVNFSTTVGDTVLRLPIFSAAMDTLTGEEMAKSMAKAGGCGVIHKNMTIKKQVEIAAILDNERKKNDNYHFAVAVGVNDYERVYHLLSTDPSFIVVDSAHGDTKAMCEFVETLIKGKDKNNNPLGYMVDPSKLIVGNISTGDAALRLYRSGVRIVKIGQGSGSICSTRIVAGIGVPQFQAIHNIDAIRTHMELEGLHIIADGGLRYSGDIVKALAAGADAVMLGGMLAGTDESLGGIEYRGMGSISAMEAGSASRYNNDLKKLTPEGVEGTVCPKGPVADILAQIEGGIRAGMGYTGSSNLGELRESWFTEITNSGLRESHPHSLLSIKPAPNYK
jgi:IMP dehydrogenase